MHGYVNVGDAKTLLAERPLPFINPDMQKTCESGR
jgi:hypothetical protein